LNDTRGGANEPAVAQRTLIQIRCLEILPVVLFVYASGIERLLLSSASVLGQSEVCIGDQVLGASPHYASTRVRSALVHEPSLERLRAVHRGIACTEFSVREAVLIRVGLPDALKVLRAIVILNSVGLKKETG
jgi:hypothetical protein